MLKYNDIIKASKKYPICLDYIESGKIGIRLTEYVWSWFRFYIIIPYNSKEPYNVVKDNPDVFFSHNYSQITGKRTTRSKVKYSVYERLEKYTSK